MHRPRHNLRRDQQSLKKEYASVAVADQANKLAEHSPYLRERIEKTLRLVAPKAGMKILDLGCAVGTMSFAAASHGAEVTGIDYTPEMIDKARHLAAERNIDNVTFQVGDVSETHFAGDSLDSIIATDIVEHLYPDLRQKTLHECYKALKHGGGLGHHGIWSGA